MPATTSPTCGGASDLNSRPSPAREALVVGGDSGPNSIGLYAAGLAVAAGASWVVYLDRDATRLDIAGSLGAEAIEASEFPRKVGAFAITVDASGAEPGLRCALESTAFDGWCTSPSVYLQDPSLPMFSMYSRCCTLHTGLRPCCPAIPAVLAAVDAGFDPGKVTSTVVDWDEAESALAEPPMKLVIARSSSAST